MALPDVRIIKSAGGLGRQKPTEDGVSGLIIQGVAIAGKLELGKVYVLASLLMAEALGLTKTAAPKIHYHISEFYRLSPGATLVLMVVAQDVSLAEMADKTLPYAKKLLTAQNGKVKQLALVLNPAAGYVPVVGGGMDSDVLAAVVKANALAVEEYSQHRPVFVLIGGHGLQADTSTAADLHTQQAENVSIVVAADHQLQPKEPATGACLGVISAAQVHLNIGWVGGFPLASDGSFLNAGLCNGAAYEDLAATGELELLHGKGYILAVQHPGEDGFFFSDSPTCTALDSDYCQIENVRTINKAGSIVRASLLKQLKGPLLLNEDGTIRAEIVVGLEEKAKTALEVQMGRAGEISALDVYIDPDQKIASGSKLAVKISIVPVGVSKNIEATIGLATAL